MVRSFMKLCVHVAAMILTIYIAVLAIFGSLFILLADGMLRCALWGWGKVSCLAGIERQQANSLSEPSGRAVIPMDSTAAAN